jgi:glycosyltransferase involved in cell wall biosynthesis
MLFYRDTPFLRPAIASILSQSFSDFELVLVDNGSGLPVEALGELGRDPRLVLVRNQHHVDISLAWNIGVAASRGEYVALMDSDDIALPDRLLKQVEALRNPSLGLVFTCADIIDEAGCFVEKAFSLLRPEEHFTYSQYTVAAISPTCTGRKEVFLKYPFRLEVNYAHDYDFFAQTVEHWQTICLPEVLLQYRRHSQQTTIVKQLNQNYHAGMIRLLTARRRSGRPEDLAGLCEALGDPGRFSALDEVYWWFSRRALSEGFSTLAVYHARKLLSVRRDGRSMMNALRVASASFAQTPGQANALARLFFMGPVRAHRLRPA